MAVMTKPRVLALIILGGDFGARRYGADQVFSFQTYRKRVFHLWSIHHHFELQAWRRRRS